MYKAAKGVGKMGGVGTSVGATVGRAAGASGGSEDATGEGDETRGMARAAGSPVVGAASKSTKKNVGRVKNYRAAQGRAKRNYVEKKGGGKRGEDAWNNLSKKRRKALTRKEFNNPNSTAPSAGEDKQAPAADGAGPQSGGSHGRTGSPSKDAGVGGGQGPTAGEAFNQTLAQGGPLARGFASMGGGAKMAVGASLAVAAAVGAAFGAGTAAGAAGVALTGYGVYKAHKSGALKTGYKVTRDTVKGMGVGKKILVGGAAAAGVGVASAATVGLLSGGLVPAAGLSLAGYSMYKGLKGRPAAEYGTSRKAGYSKTKSSWHATKAAAGQGLKSYAHAGLVLGAFSAASVLMLPGGMIGVTAAGAAAAYGLSKTTLGKATGASLGAHIQNKPQGRLASFVRGVATPGLGAEDGRNWANMDKSGKRAYVAGKTFGVAASAAGAAAGWMLTRAPLLATEAAATGGLSLIYRGVPAGVGLAAAGFKHTASIGYARDQTKKYSAAKTEAKKNWNKNKNFMSSRAFAKSSWNARHEKAKAAKAEGRPHNSVELKSWDQLSDAQRDKITNNVYNKDFDSLSPGQQNNLIDAKYSEMWGVEAKETPAAAGQSPDGNWYKTAANVAESKYDAEHGKGSFKSLPAKKQAKLTHSEYNQMQKKAAPKGRLRRGVSAVMKAAGFTGAVDSTLSEDIKSEGLGGQWTQAKDAYKGAQAADLKGTTQEDTAPGEGKTSTQTPEVGGASKSSASHGDEERYRAIKDSMVFAAGRRKRTKGVGDMLEEMIEDKPPQ
ncbi:MAG: hypothetical protein GF334_11510 [Candidatus Altiarchaeales archaeon]|nr:hypothetical protein [Candidatus Altiarchaeales archaeon]